MLFGDGDLPRRGVNLPSHVLGLTAFPSLEGWSQQIVDTPLNSLQATSAVCVSFIDWATKGGFEFHGQPCHWTK
jgi:hypothetical protein